MDRRLESSEMKRGHCLAWSTKHKIIDMNIGLKYKFE